MSSIDSRVSELLESSVLDPLIAEYLRCMDKMIKIDGNQIILQNDPEAIEAFFNLLFTFIYRSTKLMSVTYTGNVEEYSGQVFKNRSNNWGGDDSGEECDGYFDCDFDDVISLEDAGRDTLTYNLSYHGVDDLCDPEPLDRVIIFYLEKLLEEYGMDDVYVQLPFDDFTLINSAGFNDDHRGSDHTKIKLDHHDQCNLTDTFTFRDIVDISYRVKSHKFDYWYELYCGVKDVHIDGHVLEITIDFDHGS